jgi:hypothetical protein
LDASPLHSTAWLVKFLGPFRSNFHKAFQRVDHLMRYCLGRSLMAAWITEHHDSPGGSAVPCFEAYQARGKKASMSHATFLALS